MYTWVRLSDSVTVGSSEMLAVGVLAVTTTYRLTIADGCGSASGDVTISVPLPTTLGLIATAVSQNQISVTWPAIGGAAQYFVERRSGSIWELVATTTTPAFTDMNIAPSRTYAYHVRSSNG